MSTDQSMTTNVNDDKPTDQIVTMMTADKKPTEQSKGTKPTKDSSQQEPFSPQIIGIYGLPGAGKSTLLNELKQKLSSEDYFIVDGSDLLFADGEDADEVMRAFKQLGKPEQEAKRREAIKGLQKKCKTVRKHAIVAGHYMFWEDVQKEGDVVWTAGDADVYTHMMYLHVQADELHKRRAADTKRVRSKLSVEQLSHWQGEEYEQLREVCYRSNIPFITIFRDDQKAETLVKAFVGNGAGGYEDAALDFFQQRFDQLHTSPVDRVLVIDADKTLSTSDAGSIFCATTQGCVDALEKIFNSPLQYSASAFYQIMLLFEESCPDEAWSARCQKIASYISIHEEFVELLRMAAERDNAGVVVATCGIGEVWEQVLENHGLRDSVTVIGGGRLRDKMVVTPDVKERIVSYLQSEKNAFVWAFGDSQLDLKMLTQADQAVVVVCGEEVRSKSMDKELMASLSKGGLFARQTLLPSTVKPRLDGHLLPIVHPADIIFETALKDTLQLVHATNRPASKMLAAPTRTHEIQGLALQKAHRDVGYYLAMELLPKATGLEKYNMSNVEKNRSEGHRIRNECKTVIVSCMRGGDPLAQGVFKALPSAIYVHAHEPTDLENGKHLKAVRDAKNILLCDFVVNEGETMVDMVKKIRKDLNKTARIVMMAGVVQAGSVREGGGLAEGLKGYRNVSLVTLRLSENKYKGVGDTDTGSRLFNTTKAEKVTEAEKPAEVEEATKDEEVTDPEKGQ